MARGLNILFLLLSATFIYSSRLTAARRLVSPQVIKAGYWPSGLNPTYPPSSIDFSYFNHVLYAFVEPDPTSYKLVISSDDAVLLNNFTSTLHAQCPPVKALLSIGGGGSNSTAFAALARTAADRSAFIASTIAVARKYNLDGLDLDWEFPADPTEMTNLGKLFKEWRATFEREAAATRRPRLLLTSAVYFASHFFLSGVPRAYPAAAMARSLDWANVMCFDYHGGWNRSATGAHAALFDPHSNISTSYGLTSWLSTGLPAGKLVMGLPLYGRTWRLKDPKVNGIGAPAVGLGPGESDGTIVYSKVVEFNAANNAMVVDDKAAGAAYSYAGDSWIGYDDPTSVGWKVKFARGLGIRGYFFWALGYDYDSTISIRAFVAWGSKWGTMLPGDSIIP